MPKKTVKFRITTPFTEKAIFWAPGERELDYRKAKQFHEEGKGVFVNEDDTPDDDIESTEVEEETTADDSSEIPEDFPKREVLVENGYDTMEKIRDAKQEDLLEIEGIGDATLNTIGNAVSEFFE